MANKKFTTTKQLDNLKPEETAYELSDAGAPGLRVRVEPTGRKSFRWTYRLNGKRKIHTFGKYPDTALVDARKALEEAKEKVADGVAPGQVADAPKTVSQLSSAFYEKRIKPVRKRPDAVQQVLNHDILPVIGSKKLSSITAPVLGSIVDTVVARGATAHAGKVLAILKQMFDWAEGRGFIERSPADKLKAQNFGVTSGQRSRSLDTDANGDPLSNLTEIPALWAALDSAPRLSPSIRYGLKILLLTGVRSQELRLAQWPHLDLESGMWSIPVENQKLNPKQIAMAKSWQVPLPPLAIAQFKMLKKCAINEWVMPGRKDGPVTDKAIGRATSRLFDLKDGDGSPLLPIDRFSPHDLRRTLRTHLDRFRIPPHISESCLNHSLGKITQTYATSSYLDERREALKMWADAVELAINPQDNVVMMEAR